MDIILNVVCNVQHKFDKACAFRGVQTITTKVDLMIIDILKGLSIPMVFSPPTFVLEWNSIINNFLLMVFDFGSLLIHDNRVLLFLHKDNL